MTTTETKCVVWLTDLHFNFLKPDEVDAFLARVADCRADAVLFSGDVGESKTVVGYLRDMADRLEVAIYFVLGNHDFYYGSIRQVRRDVEALTREDPRLVWLNAAGVVELAPRVGLVGHDGWADARLGDYVRSLVMMNDYRLIEEFAGLSKEDRWPKLKAHGDEAAEHVRRVLPEALARYPQVFLLTHVPPFREACWHDGKISDDEWLPHFASRAMGEVLLTVMRDFPDRALTVLCGHTHGRGEARPADNILVLTGGAEYGAPEIQRVFDLS